MMSERLNDLMQLMERANARSLTAKDRMTIQNISKEYGMYFRNTGCPNCWRDQVTLLVLHTRKLIKKAGNK